MNKLITALSISLLSLSSVATCYPSIYEVSSSPYASRIAQAPGDILTVIVNETASTLDAGTANVDKKDSMDIALNKFFTPPFNPTKGFSAIPGAGTAPGLDLSSEHKFQANAQFDSNKAFSTTLQVRIIEIEKNGQYVIQGERNLMMNGKNTRITINGVIRRDDITPNNTINSAQIADAQVEIDGEVVGKDLQPGWISKFLSKIFF